MMKSKYLIHMHAGRSQTTLRMLAATLLLWSSITVAIQYEYEHPAWDDADPEHDYTELCTSPGDYSNLRHQEMEAFVKRILELPISGHYFEEDGVKHVAGKVEYLVALSSEDVPDERYAIALPTILLQVSRIPLCRQYLIDNFKNIQYPKFQYLLAQETTRYGGFTDEIKDYLIKTKASGEYIEYLCEGLGKYTQDCREGLRREHKNQ